MLLEESGIAPEIAAERGYRTAGRSGVPEAFRRYQRRPGLLVPMYSPDGTTTSHQLRPDAPRVRDGKTVKYETAGGSRCIIDVHPRMRGAAGDAGAELWITEGVKKADALTSRGLCAVGLVGVWNWQRDGELLPCWDHVALEGREVRVIFDSDVMVKPGVQLALERLVAALGARGARVQVVYLPDAEDGSKVGADDYLVAGGTVEDLRALARPFEPSEVGSIRLSRDGKLAAAVGTVRARWWGTDWSRLVGTGERPNTMRGHSCRDVMHALIERAARYGRPVEGGVAVVAATRPVALEAATSRQTVMKALRHLEAEGLLRRAGDPDGEAGEAGRYVLLARNVPGGRATLDHDGRGCVVREGEGSPPAAVYDRGGKDPRSPSEVPRLRWSACKVDREIVREEPPGGGDPVRHERRTYWPIKRLGKIRGAVVDALVAAGGTLTLEELREVLRKTRARDLVRRASSAHGKGRDGILVMLEDVGIITVEGGVVALDADWSGALERERELAGELEAERLQAGDYARDREAFRNRHEAEPDRAPTEAEMDATREGRRRRREDALEERRRRPVSPLAAAIRDYLERNPHDADKPAGWLGSTLWAFDLYPASPAPRESQAAVEELGGDGYRAVLLRERRRAA